MSLSRLLLVLIAIVWSCTTVNGGNEQKGGAAVQKSTPRAEAGKKGATVQEIPAPPYATQVIAADFSHKGRVDIAVISNTPVMAVFFNDGTSDFKNTKLYETRTHNMSLCAADFNKDGMIDIIPQTEGRVGPFYLGNQQGDFTLYNKGLESPGRGRFIIARDLNKDGLPDLISVGYGYANVYYNKGGLDFDLVSFPMGASFVGKSVDTYDLNGNGYEDIIFTDYANGSLYVIWNGGARNLRKPQEVYHEEGSPLTSSVPLAIAGHAGPVIAVTVENKAQIRFLEPQKEGPFTLLKNMDAPPYPSYMISADMNNDGIADLILNTVPQPGIPAGISVCYGPSYRCTDQFTVKGTPFYFTAADWDGDGFLDIFVPCYYDTNIIAFIPSPGKYHKTGSSQPTGGGP